jgi:hypothetical protein
MRIEAHKTSYYIEFKNPDFETQVKRHDEINKFEAGVDKSKEVN